MLRDSYQRQKATNPALSFIIQAPAGSGKTEILTQRYLRLLSQVSAPEQIVALTFTRKAACEMRERIVLALKQAAEGIKATSPHQAQTLAYASAALAQSHSLEWQILHQPRRLRIMTLDSFSQMISQAIPLQENPTAYARITEKPSLHYQEAARSCLDYALNEKKLNKSIQCLLEHLDNRQDKLFELFADLLNNRSQWLGPLYSAREQSKAKYEQMLALIEAQALNRFKQNTPLTYRQPLCDLVRELAYLEKDAQSPWAPLKTWHHFDALNRELASGLSALLLTSQQRLRKSFDHHVGLKRDSCDGSTYEKLKIQSKDLLSLLSDLPAFLDSLISVGRLPLPAYEAEQWEVLQALFNLLPILVAHLQLRFSECNEIDFTTVTEQALLALGNEEHPTDLALYLDYAIHHLLVDEFQDTSLQQFQLLSKLVQAWEPQSGKTLFLVGDPMQSIYRFRQAEVGLFLKAKQEGIGPVQLEPLELVCNFRSRPKLVDWVNQQFKGIFPSLDDIAFGAVSFYPSHSVSEQAEDSFIQARELSDSRREAKAVVSLVKELLANHPQESIAILVRSRQQLSHLLQCLREQQIPFQGLDIELLSKLPHLRDLYSLLQALLMPANRLAWLCLLRSPFCGLGLSDLYLIANYDKKKSIYYALTQLDKLADLSETGRIRAEFFQEVLAEALSYRHQQPLSEWIRQTANSLGLRNWLTPYQQADLEQFYSLLDRLSQTNPLLDWEQFKTEFHQLYSQSTPSSPVQIMTIHKSKGLEFDSVILLGLSAQPLNYDRPLLRWLALPSKKEDIYLLSPIKPAHQEHCLLYDYLGKLEEEKNHYELQRLLYVAVTRAKKRLFLFDVAEKECKNSFRALLKNQNFVKQEIDILEGSENQTQILQRLPIDFYRQSSSFRSKSNEAILIPIQDNARQIGLVAHELFQWICDYHPTSIESLPWSYVRQQFKNLGFSHQEEKSAYENLYQQIHSLFADPIGQWLIEPHQEEKNEFALLSFKRGVSEKRIIDRTFVSNGAQWIIELKTGNETEEHQIRHQAQVNEYAQLLSQISSWPIRCGIYYLKSGHWMEWRKESLSVQEITS